MEIDQTKTIQDPTGAAERADVLSMSLPELTYFIRAHGFDGYRAGQIHGWLYKGTAFDAMSNLPSDLRAFLAEYALNVLPHVREKYISAIDGTVKYVFELYDGQPIESVVMRYEHGVSICISSQAGCRMGCRFCASTLNGKDRDLLPGEMLGQIIMAQKDIKERISNVVLMGIGEPLDNYDNVLKFIRLAGDEQGLGIGQRHISLSTCGLVDRIKALAKEKLQITLSISLHAYDDDARSKLMPVNNKWNLDALLSACAYYFKQTGRRISFEYTLISGENDSPDGALRLSRLLHRYMGDMPVHVNLIPVNPVSERGFTRSGREAVELFRDTLTSQHINATVRRRLGSDINASCGQLRHKFREEHSPSTQG